MNYRFPGDSSQDGRFYKADILWIVLLEVLWLRFELKINLLRFLTNRVQSHFYRRSRLLIRYQKYPPNPPQAGGIRSLSLSYLIRNYKKQIAITYELQTTSLVSSSPPKHSKSASQGEFFCRTIINIQGQVSNLTIRVSSFNLQSANHKPLKRF